jgi:hypothetical protein
MTSTNLNQIRKGLRSETKPTLK